MRTEQYVKLNDEELISLIRSDNNNALFEILFERYQSKIHSKCILLLKDKQLASESTQNILEKIYEKLDSFKGSASFSSWVYSITYNYCIDYLRNKKKLHYPDWNKQNELPEIIEETDDENDEAEINSQRLNEILELIHPEEKALLLMKYSDDLSIKQISKALRISESAAKMRIKRAKARTLFIYQNKFANPKM